MIRKMKRAFVVPSAIVVFGALAFACGDEKDDAGGDTGGGNASGTGGGTGGDTGGPCSGTINYKAKVVDATTPTTGIAGVTVEVLDDETGQPVSPAITGTSGAGGMIGGEVTLTVDKCKPFAVKARGNADYTDTYSYHVRIDASGKPDALFRMGSNNTSALVPTLAGYPVLQDRAPAAGAVYWKKPSESTYGVVGCAHIKLADGAGTKDIPEDWALRYFKETVPSGLEQWKLEWGTRDKDGRFFVGNATPGNHTFVALVDGKEIGRTDMVIFPRSTGSTQVMGMPANLYLAGIYIDATDNSATNPTPAGCADTQK